MYKFKSYGRKIYIYSYVVALVLSFLTTGFYSTGLEETVEWIVTIFEGALITFMYFTPIKENLVNEKNICTSYLYNLLTGCPIGKVAKEGVEALPTIMQKIEETFGPTWAKIKNFFGGDDVTTVAKKGEFNFPHGLTHAIVRASIRKLCDGKDMMHVKKFQVGKFLKINLKKSQYLKTK